MRIWTKIGIDMLAISLMVSFASSARPAFDRHQTQRQRVIHTFVAPTNPGAGLASTPIVSAAHSDNKSSRGNAKGKPKKKTRAAGQRAHADTIDQYRV